MLQSYSTNGGLCYEQYNTKQPTDGSRFLENEGFLCSYRIGHILRCVNTRKISMVLVVVVKRFCNTSVQ